MQPHGKVSGGDFSHDVNHLYRVPVALPVCCDTERRKEEVNKKKSKQSCRLLIKSAVKHKGTFLKLSPLNH